MVMVMAMVRVRVRVMIMVMVRAVYLQALPSFGAQSGVRNVISALVRE